MGLLQVLVAASVLLSLWFVLYLGPPGRSERPVVAWLLAAWAWSTCGLRCQKRGGCGPRRRHHRIT